jgi:predicted RNase H-like HicB family nuclease
MTYTVVLLREADGRYSAVVPALDVASWGHSLPEALRMVQDALELYVGSVYEQGGSVPPDRPEVQVQLGEASEAFLYKLEVPGPLPGATHAVLHSPKTGRIAVVPVHSDEDPPPHALRAILRQTGLTVEEFTKLLK